MLPMCCVWHSSSNVNDYIEDCSGDDAKCDYDDNDDDDDDNYDDDVNQVA